MTAAIEVGDFINILPFGPVTETRRGICRFYGETEFADGLWVGVELVGSVGKNSGSVANKEYFQCLPNQGVFVRPELVESFAGRTATPVAAPIPGFDMEIRADLEEAKEKNNDYEKKIVLLEEKVEGLELDLEIATEEQGLLTEQVERLEAEAKLGGGSSGGGNNNAAVEEILQLRKTVETLRTERDSANERVEDLKASLNAAGSSDEMMEELTEAKLALEDRVEVYKEKIEALTKENKDLAELIEMQEHEMSEQREQADGFGSKLEAIRAEQVAEMEKILHQNGKMRQMISELEEKIELVNIDSEEKMSQLQISSNLDRSRAERTKVLEAFSPVLLGSVNTASGLLPAVLDGVRCLLPKLNQDVDMLQTAAELSMCHRTTKTVAEVVKNLHDAATAEKASTASSVAVYERFDVVFTSIVASFRAEAWSNSNLEGLVSLKRVTAPLPASCSQMLELASDGIFNKSWRQIFGVMRKSLGGVAATGENASPSKKDGDRNTDAAASDAVGQQQLLDIVSCPPCAKEEGIVASLVDGANMLILELSTVNDYLTGELKAEKSAVIESVIAEARQLINFLQSLTSQAADVALAPALMHCGGVILSSLRATHGVTAFLDEKKSDLQRGFCESFPTEEFTKVIQASLERPPAVVGGTESSSSTPLSCLDSLLSGLEIGSNAIGTLLEGCVSRIQREWNCEVKIVVPQQRAGDGKSQENVLSVSQLQLLDRAQEIDTMLTEAALQRVGATAQQGAGGSADNQTAAPGTTSVDSEELKKLNETLAKLQKENYKLSIENQVIEPSKKEISNLTEQLRNKEEEHKSSVKKIESDYEVAFASMDRELQDCKSKLREAKQYENRAALSPLSKMERTELQTTIRYLEARLNQLTSCNVPLVDFHIGISGVSTTATSSSAAGSTTPNPKSTQKQSADGTDGATKKKPTSSILDSIKKRALKRPSTKVLAFGTATECSQSCATVYARDFQ